jgi:hypothetical protein
MDKLKHIEPGTPEMETYLAVGYQGMSVAKAEAIIEERKRKPELWPYAELQKAEAFLEAYRSRPSAVDTAPGHWRGEVHNA